MLEFGTNTGPNIIKQQYVCIYAFLLSKKVLTKTDPLYKLDEYERSKKIHDKSRDQIRLFYTK